MCPNAVLTDNVWIVIPAYNEGPVITATMRDVRQYFSKVVVVDDSSTDQTADFAYEEGAHVCRHPINMGQGAALQTGIDYALSKGAEAIVSLDADGQHRASDAFAMVKRLFDSRSDVILGSRFLGSTEDMSRGRALLLRAATLYTRMTTGLSVTDTHNGLRVFSRAASNRIRIRHNRMAHASEILNLIAEKDLSYEEFPCTVRYSTYSLAKGQKFTGLFGILFDLYIGRLHK